MKVFVNKRNCGYSGGMILVAANSAEEAHKAFHADDDYSWMWYENYDGMEIDYYYQRNGWVEVEGLTCDTEIPCVIDEDGYAE